MFPTTNSERDFMSNIPYRETDGSLLWCSKVCRPDLSYAVNQVAKLNSNPGIVTLIRLHQSQEIEYNKMLEELGIETVKPIVIQEDNKACIWYSEHPPGSYEKTKHVKRKFPFVQQQVSEGTIKLDFRPSAENLAVSFTKPLATE